jgi:hypothetical protein
MSGDDGEFLDQFQPERPPPTGEQLAFGEVHYPWCTPYPYDGPQAPAPRRPEILGDAEDGWWADVTTWTEWAIATFRLSRWFPPCWLRHPALVEEAQALWLLWCQAWLPGVEPSAPVGFLHNLSLALNRIETLWQISCRDSHSEPIPERPSVRVRPLTQEWWSAKDYDRAAAAW